MAKDKIWNRELKNFVLSRKLWMTIFGLGVLYVGLLERSRLFIFFCCL